MKIEEALDPILGRLFQQTRQLPGQTDSKIGIVGLEGSNGQTDNTSSITATPNVVAPPLPTNVSLVNLGPPYNQAQAPPQGVFVTPMPPAVSLLRRCKRITSKS